MAERRVRAVPRPTYNRPQPQYRRTPRARLSLPFSSSGRRLLILLGGLAVIIVVLAQVFTVRTVTVAAPSYGEQIQQKTQAALDESLRQGNLLTADVDALGAAVLAADPMIKSLEIKRQWPSGLAVTATLKEPGLGWSSGNRTYLLDRDGGVIGDVPTGSSLPVVVDASNVPVEVGDRVVTARFVTFASEVARGLGEQGIGVSRIEVRDTTLDLYVVTNKGYYLIFDTSRGAAGELADLKAVLTTLAKERRAPASYIDLRISGKAYFK